MQNGWVKLHRKILQNELFERDKTALLVFIHLLLIVDRDGRWHGGRFQLASICKLKPSTLYSALNRLSVNTTVNTKSNNKYTTISICNWSTYQAVVNNKTYQPSTTGQQQRQHSNKNVATKNKNQESDYVVSETSPSYLKAKSIREQIRAKSP